MKSVYLLCFLFPFIIFGQDYDKTPAMYNGDTLFYIYLKDGMMMPEDRADEIEKRLEQLETRIYFNEDSLKLFVGEAFAEIKFGNTIIQHITHEDAHAEKKSLEHLGKEHLKAIKEAVEYKVGKKNPKALAIEIAWGLFFTVLLVFSIWVLNFLFGKLVTKKLWALIEILQGIRIGQYDILSADMEQKLARFFVRMIKIALILFLVYVYFMFLFNVFPWTKHFSALLANYLFAPVTAFYYSTIDYIPKVIMVVIIVVIFKYIILFFKLYFKEVERKELSLPGFHSEWAKLTFNLLRFILVILMIVFIFPYLPFSSSPAFQGVTVFLGILFSLGSTTSITNIISGFIITYMRPYQLGDRIKINDIEGVVVYRNLLITRVRTLKNEEITIPNSNILNHPTVNYSHLSNEYPLILHTKVTIGYDVPWRQVHELLQKAATATEGVLVEPKPFVIQESLNDFYVCYEINAYTDQPHTMHLIYGVLHQNIQDKFFEAGVEIMSPHYTSLRDGNTTAVPPQYRPKDYTADGFIFKK